MFEATRPTFSDHFDALNLKILRGFPIRLQDEEGCFVLGYVLAGTDVIRGLARLERLSLDGRDVERLTVPASAVFWPDPCDVLLM